ncbi:MAG: hypothetical protein H0T46_00680 [Deltaproteobacteria bacterium]|nr:hypothetical protein [Deltaproteobacteria bacterium]
MLKAQPKKVLITRTGSSNHERLNHAPGLVMFIPSVGESMRMFLESGKLVQTSPVTRVKSEGDEIVVETRNSKYLLELAA